MEGGEEGTEWRMDWDKLGGGSKEKRKLSGGKDVDYNKLSEGCEKRIR